MFGKSLIGLCIMFIGLLFYNVVSLAWMLLIQLVALTGLVFIGTLIINGRLSNKSDEESKITESPPHE